MMHCFYYKVGGTRNLQKPLAETNKVIRLFGLGAIQALKSMNPSFRLTHLNFDDPPSFVRAMLRNGLAESIVKHRQQSSKKITFDDLIKNLDANDQNLHKKDPNSVVTKALRRYLEDEAEIFRALIESPYPHQEKAKQALAQVTKTLESLPTDYEKLSPHEVEQLKQLIPLSFYLSNP